jgi:AraC-like DNA-binding protein
MDPVLTPMFTEPPTHGKHPNWRSGLRKLSDEEVEKARKKWRNRPTIKSMADEMGVSERYLRKLLHNEKRVKKS